MYVSFNGLSSSATTLLVRSDVGAVAKQQRTGAAGGASCVLTWRNVANVRKIDNQISRESRSHVAWH